MHLHTIKTFGELKQSGYKSKTIQEELRENLIQKISNGETVFKGILGYEDTVIPELERAILSGHSINLLGLRGQAKTRLARLMVNLLDEYIPYIAGSEVNDDPYAPVSHFGKTILNELGDNTPIEWLHKSQRYVEKLATPDVTVADLIGDLDPVKAINQKLSYSDEKAIHFGLIPRSNRSIFVINEIPDLQARIQVALFNILQEGDIQIRGFKMRLPLNIQFVFTANPEDYTNRGSIITPLKDRIGSQIITHYPKDIATAAAITASEAKIKTQQTERVVVHELLAKAVEQIVFEARQSEFVDAKSGVSARLSISAFELLVSTIERRSIKNHDKISHGRIADLYSLVPAITGKVEMVYEGETEGPLKVAQNLISKAIRQLFAEHCPPLEKMKKKGNDSSNPYKGIMHWFEEGKHLELHVEDKDVKYRKQLDSLPELEEFIERHYSSSGNDERYLMKELILFGLSENSKLSRSSGDKQISFKDLLGSMFTGFSNE